MKTFFNENRFNSEVTFSANMIDIYAQVFGLPSFAICAYELRQTDKNKASGTARVKVTPICDYKKMTSKHLLNRIATAESIANTASDVCINFLGEDVAKGEKFDVFKVTKNTQFVITDKAGAIFRVLEIDSEDYRLMRKAITKGATPDMAAAICFAHSKLLSIADHIARVIERGRKVDIEEETQTLERMYGGKFRRASAEESASKAQASAPTAQDKAQALRLYYDKYASKAQDIKNGWASLYKVQNRKGLSEKAKDALLQGATDFLTSKMFDILDFEIAM